jgi:hypothetical protein
MMLKLRGMTEDDFVRLMRRRWEGDRSWWESVVGSSVSGLMSSGSGLVRGTQYLGPLGPLRLAAHYLGYRTPEDFVAEYLKEGSEYVSDGLVNPEYRYSNGVAGALGAAAPYIAGAAVLPAGLPAGAAELLMGLVGGSAAGAEAYERGKARGMQGEELTMYVAIHVLIDGVSTGVMAKGALPGGSISGRVGKSTPLGKAAAETLEKSAAGRVVGTAVGHTADNVVTGQARQRLSNYVERLFGNTEVGIGDNTKETLVNDLFVGGFSTLPKLPKAWRGYEVAGKARVDLDKPLELGEAEPVEKPVPVARTKDGRVSFEEPKWQTGKDAQTSAWYRKIFDEKMGPIRDEVDVFLKRVGGLPPDWALAVEGVKEPGKSEANELGDNAVYSIRNPRRGGSGQGNSGGDAGRSSGGISGSDRKYEDYDHRIPAEIKPQWQKLRQKAADVLGRLQQRVRDDIQDPDAQVGFTGSLARGYKLKEFDNVEKNGTPVNLKDFDVDVFIVSDKLVENSGFDNGYARWGRKVKSLWRPASKLVETQDLLHAIFKETMPGYRGAKPIQFRIYTTAEFKRMEKQNAKPYLIQK